MRVTLWCCALMVAGCGAGTTGLPGDAESPPTEAAALERWLTDGTYKKWKCEAAPHAGRPGTGHSTNRICSNALHSAHGDGEFPVGAASVKELFEGDVLKGYAVMRKVAAGKGEAWYWYERIGSSVVADGTGVSLCTGCHAQAGSSAARTGHDFVYTQVR